MVKKYKSFFAYLGLHIIASKKYKPSVLIKFTK